MIIHKSKLPMYDKYKKYNPGEKLCFMAIEKNTNQNIGWICKESGLQNSGIA